MKSPEIRSAFLEFFRSKGHAVVPSAPMVVKDDPTLLFTNAGMNQFKDCFLGNRRPPSPRVADTQKCLRVSGKHNDLEEVGTDTYHHTMFEMLGNWSFGDYYKAEAIAWAWELLTAVYGIDRSRIYVTVFAGDKKDGLPADDEARALWEKFVDTGRVLGFGKKDNFWEMGDTGPCGPCSEIHVDLRDEGERQRQDGAALVNAGHPEVLEIWNLVFIGYDRKKDGSLSALPQTHVDTGMGFERLCMVLQGKNSSYDTDVFSPLIAEAGTISGVQYGASAATDIALRVAADHVRAVAFSIADGQLPSNTGAGYVIRRILRRAIRYGFSFLGQNRPFVHRLVPVLADTMGDAFPELRRNRDLITSVIREEEENFLHTLEKGIARFEKEAAKLDWSQRQFPGEVAFELFDTYGFPVDLTALMAREKGLAGIDEGAYDRCLKEQKDRSRGASKMEAEDWVVLRDVAGGGFVGYDQREAEVVITKYRKVRVKGKDLYQLVFDKTPFYAESGGQIGDTGYIDKNGAQTRIIDTKRENELIIHFTETLPQRMDAHFKAVVDADKRAATERNHSATHLLHAALRRVLGSHVEQKGSLVDAGRLRFDFSHFRKVEKEEMEAVTKMVNEEIARNHAREEQRDVPMDEAKKTGAIALFGEKYGDRVRVIRFGDSLELCGGTHVKATGDIGTFRIVKESSVAAGVRRVEAVTGEAALRELKELEVQFNDLSKALDEFDDWRRKKEFESISDLLKLYPMNSQEETDSSIQERKAELKRAQEIDNAIGEAIGSSPKIIDIKLFRLEAEGVLNKAESFQQANQTTLPDLEWKSFSDRIEAVRQGVNVISELRDPIANAYVKMLSEEFQQTDHIKFLVKKLSGLELPIGHLVAIDADLLRDIAYPLRNMVSNNITVLGAIYDNQPVISISVSNHIIDEKGIKANELVKEIAKDIKGGGGGQPFFATAGGGDASGIDRALERAEEMIKARLSGGIRTGK